MGRTAPVRRNGCHPRDNGHSRDVVQQGRGDERWAVNQRFETSHSRRTYTRFLLVGEGYVGAKDRGLFREKFCDHPSFRRGRQNSTCHAKAPGL